MVENGLKPLVRSLALHCYNSMKGALRANRWVAPVVILACSLGLAGCASISKSGKAQPVAAHQNPGGLVHPTRPEDVRGKEPATTPSKRGAGEQKEERQEPGSRISVATAAGAHPTAAPEKSGTVPVPSSSESQPAGRITSEKPSSERPPKTQKSPTEEGEPSRSSAKPPEDGDSPFKKHDHAQYERQIHNAAIDTVNKDEKAVYARVCKDATTDDWSLSIYHLHGNTYSFVTYAWDDVDRKWVEAFVSDKRPLTRWKSHLDFSSAGRDCKVLKERTGGGVPKAPR